MFDSAVWRECVPPKPCMVSTAAAFPHLGYGGSWRADRVKLYVRTNGLRIEPEMLGELHAWVKLVDDSWMAKVLVRPTLLRRQFPMTLWVTANAVRGAEPPDGA